MTAEIPDEIDALVDYQLSQRPLADRVMWSCRSCKARWESGPVLCPECGERRQT